MNAERVRLTGDAHQRARWHKWGPYLSDRAWATVREDYSGNGDAWSFLPHDLAADYVWIPRILPAARRLRTDPGWTILYDGKQSVIFGRAGLPSIRRVASVAAATTPRIFPGP